MIPKVKFLSMGHDTLEESPKQTVPYDILIVFHTCMFIYVYYVLVFFFIHTQYCLYVKYYLQVCCMEFNHHVMSLFNDNRSILFYSILVLLLITFYCLLSIVSVLSVFLFQ